MLVWSNYNHKHHRVASTNDNDSNNNNGGASSNNHYCHDHICDDGGNDNNSGDDSSNNHYCHDHTCDDDGNDYDCGDYEKSIVSGYNGQLWSFHYVHFTRLADTLLLSMGCKSFQLMNEEMIHMPN